MRLDIFPLLGKINSKATEHINECANSVREAEEYLSEVAGEWLRDNKSEDGSLDAPRLAEQKCWERRSYWNGSEIQRVMARIFPEKTDRSNMEYVKWP